MGIEARQGGGQVPFSALCGTIDILGKFGHKKCLVVHHLSPMLLSFNLVLPIIPYLS